MYRASQVAQMVKNPLANAGDTRDSSSTPGSGRSPGRGNGNPLQNPSLENSMDRGAWQPTVHGMAKSRTPLSTEQYPKLGGISVSADKLAKELNGCPY